MKHPFMLVACSLLLLCQLAAAQQAARTIYLVRHAEKTSAAPDAMLSPAGEARAACLARTLKDAGIRQIFVSDAKRTQQTAGPLAQALKIAPSVIPARDTSSLVRDLSYSSGNVLVVGHSDTLPVIIARLQAGTVQPIGDNEYDRLFVITMVESSGTPVATLRYCDCAETSPAKPAAPKPQPKTKAKP